MEEKFEIRIGKVEYSVYAIVSPDYSKKKNTTCTDCGCRIVVNPTTVEIRQIFDAERMVEIELTQRIVTEARRKIIRKEAIWHQVCDSCYEAHDLEWMLEQLNNE